MWDETPEADTTDGIQGQILRSNRLTRANSPAWHGKVLFHLWIPVEAQGIVNHLRDLGIDDAVSDLTTTQYVVGICIKHGDAPHFTAFDHGNEEIAQQPKDSAAFLVASWDLCIQKWRGACELPKTYEQASTQFPLSPVAGKHCDRDVCIFQARHYQICRVGHWPGYCLQA